MRFEKPRSGRRMLNRKTDFKDHPRLRNDTLPGRYSELRAVPKLWKWHTKRGDRDIIPYNESPEVTMRFMNSAR